MTLNVAVQMDPIERINIRGDSTFALLLEAQRRRHALAYFTPDRLPVLGDTGDDCSGIRPDPYIRNIAIVLCSDNGDRCQ